MGKVLTQAEWRERYARLRRGVSDRATFDELAARAATHFPVWELADDHDLLIAVQFRTEVHADAVRAWCRECLFGEAFVSSSGRECVVYCQLSSDAGLLRQHWVGATCGRGKTQP